jgi:hypothetical protein
VTVPKPTEARQEAPGLHLRPDDPSQELDSIGEESTRPAEEAGGDDGEACASARLRALELALAGNAETMGAQVAQIESLKQERAELALATARMEAERDVERAARERAETELAESRVQLSAVRDKLASLERAYEEAKADADKAGTLVDDLRAAERALAETRALVAEMKGRIADVTKAMAGSDETGDAPAPRTKGPGSVPRKRSEDTRVAARPTAQEGGEVTLVPEVVQDVPGSNQEGLVNHLVRFLEPD